ncbi:hypothetical protein CCL21_10855 [Pseudomonas syringae]|nr:hypothetical protein CCL21_10855 [Pseudomonas syringae]
MFAKGPVHSPKMRRLKHRLREQAKRRPVRSYALRAEAWQPFIQGAPGLMYMMSAERRNESLCVVTWLPCPALAGGSRHRPGIRSGGCG